YNNMVETLPSPAVLPSIIHYNMPDANQTIVSSWNCSPKVVSVGNTRTRITYTDYNGDLFVGDPFPPVGHLSQNSSKGPNRLNVIKPDVSASGDGTMAAAPLWILAEPINYFRIDEGGWHMRNGGTSMASPVVAGTAALFLERCDKGNYATFIQELHASATSNDYTGNLPNNAYGHGWLDAHQLMLNQEFTASLVADTAFCVPPVAVEIEATDSIYQVVWSNGSTDFPYYQHTSGALSAIAYNAAGCGVNTDTLDFVQLATETIDPIVVAPDLSYLTTTSSNDTYQWTYNGTDIAGATGDTLYLTSGMQAGSYDCYTTSTDGCSTYAGAVSLNLTVQQNIIQTIEVYPNPTSSMLYINSEDEVLSAQIIDISGKVISATIQNNAVKVNHLSNGFYTLQLNTAKGIASFKFVKQ
ncbi:MAG TPA: S8 family peptidase, partial [Taishania sp.]|nr:S8 family peptidase [Taishania sp.]